MTFTDAELTAFLDEALPPDLMARLEVQLRDDPALSARLARLCEARDSDTLSLGSLWRQSRLTCPPRGKLGSYLLGVLPPEEADYLHFHLETLGCRACQANRDDLLREQAEAEAHTTQRRRKYFESSAGKLAK